MRNKLHILTIPLLLFVGFLIVGVNNWALSK